ncbi:MAG: prpR [Nevskia sp.]|nr:prpR [Nevskia sp.]
MPSTPTRRYNRTDADAERKPVIWTVSVSRLSGLLNDVTPEYDDRALIEPINLGFEEAVRHVRRRLQSEDCDVLIAAGSNGAYLKNRVDKPVVLVRLSGFDLMQALARARKLSPRIGLVTHASDLPEFVEFQRGFGLSIEQRTFVTAEDARSSVAELVAQGVKVIVGTGLATELAEQAGVPGILLYSAETIRAAFDSALDIARVVHNPQHYTAPRASRRAPATPGLRYGLDDLLGDSAAMQQVRAAVQRCASSDATLLITGATGTGKELVAQAVHAGSTRRAQPFVAVNCGAIAESLLESELFGYDEGAFTGSRRGGRAGLIEAAQNGSLFLDEIGEMPLALQTRLLRVLEERQVLRVGSSRPLPVDIRVIAATHCDLPARVASKQFRADLFFRLNVLHIDLPNLAEHPQDLPLLAQSFLQRGSPAAAPAFAADALRLLRRHPWPGNVRELRNLMERLNLQGKIDGWPHKIDAAWLKRAAPELDAPASTPGPASNGNGSTFDPVIARPSRTELKRRLGKARGNRRAVAAQLGVSRTTLWRWLREADR